MCHLYQGILFGQVAGPIFYEFLWIARMEKAQDYL